MTTRSGRSYQKLDMADEATREREEKGRHLKETQEPRGAEGRGMSAGTLDSMIQALLKGLEEQQRRANAEEQERRERAAMEERERQERRERAAAEERERLERAFAEERERRERAAAEERERQERQVAQHAESMKLMQLQVEALRGLVQERSQETRRPAATEHVKPAKLTETDDIEAYLTTFERLMQVAGAEEDTWAVRLAPQLTGKAQQAFAAMREGDSTNYQRVKEAILKRYNISEETYRQRFRGAKKGDEETYTELVVRLEDLLAKWTASCETIGDVREKFTVEQLLSTMPDDLRVWVSERKPATAAEAGQLADDYLQARRQLPKMRSGD